MNDAAVQASVKSAQPESGQALYDALKAQILDGSLQAGDRVVPSRELQERFGISYYATLAAMKRLEDEGLVVRRRGAGTFVADAPANGGIETSKARIVAVRALSWETEHESESAFLRPLIDALKEEMERLTGAAPFLECPTAELAACVARQQADAWLCLCPSLPLDLPRPQAPMVFVAQDMETIWPDADGYDVVTADSRQGAALAAKYLRETGCRRPVILGDRLPGGAMSPHTMLRREGFQAGWGERLHDGDVILADSPAASDTAAIISQVLQRSPLPDCIFAISDDQAEGACHALCAHGIRPGKDIKLVGFDGQPPRFPRDPALTTVEVPMAELGRTAVRLALQRATEPGAPAQRILLACRLRRGETA